MDKISAGITQKDKQILKAAAPLLIVVLLFYIVSKFGFMKIKEIKQQINTNKKTISVLSGKLKILQSVSAAYSSGSDASLTALPDKNPTLSVISQLKLLASSSSVMISDVKSSLPGELADLSYVATSFIAAGTKDSIISFTRAINTIAPISIIEKIDMSTNAGYSEANISIKTYFAPLPKTIPTVTQAVTDLTASEKSLLSEISILTPPVFGEVVQTEGGSINQNPFGL